MHSPVNHLERKVTLFDLAAALGVSTGTVHRALHDHPGVSPATKARVLQLAKSMGYRPNLAARYLSRGEELRVSINTPKGTESYWDDVRAGIQKEAQALSMGPVQLEFRTYPAIREGEAEAFEEAIESGVNGIITFPSRAELMHKWMQRARQEHIPVICVTTDAPGADRLAVVSINTMISGALAADLLGRVLKGSGKVAVTLFDLMINEHAEKRRAFIETLQKYYPCMAVVDTIEDHEINAEAYEKCRALFAEHPDLAGIYICNEVSLPVIDAARDSGILRDLSIITTDLFPPLVEHIRAGRVLATIFQRPYTQGRMAFRVLHEFLVKDACPPAHLTLSPHLVMRGNLEFFLQQQSAENRVEPYANSARSIDHAELEG